MSEFSNIDEFLEGFHELGEALTLDDQELVDALGDTYSDVLRERAAGQVGPDGVSWDANQPDYARRKGYLPVGVGFTGEMLDPDNLKVTGRYQSGNITFDHSGSEASKQHLQFFEAGGRQLWGIDAETEARFSVEINKHIQEKIKSLK
jgi:hypothetical protein